MHRQSSKKIVSIKTKFSHGNISNTSTRNTVNNKVSLSSSVSPVVQVAEILRPFGIKGLMFAKLINPDFLAFIDNLQFKTSCVVSKSIKLSYLKSPFKVLELKKHKNGILVTAEDCNTREMAESIVGGFIFSNYALKKSLYLTEVVGFVLYDNDQKLGKIKSVYHNNAHGIVVSNSTEIPFVDEFIKNIDWKNKEIIMNLPKGLYEI